MIPNNLLTNDIRFSCSISELEKQKTYEQSIRSSWKTLSDLGAKGLAAEKFLLDYFIKCNFFAEFGLSAIDENKNIKNRGKGDLYVGDEIFQIKTSFDYYYRNSITIEKTKDKIEKFNAYTFFIFCHYEEKTQEFVIWGIFEGDVVRKHLETLSEIDSKNGGLSYKIVSKY